MTATTLNTLQFDNTTLDIIDKNGQQWLLGQQIAAALGYKDGSSIARIFSRNSEEFSEGMTCSVKLTDHLNIEREQRIFSRRGAHLIAMFARTDKAKAFRKWVLDVLDSVVPEVPTQAAPQALLLEAINPAQHRDIQKAMGKRVYGFNDARSIEKRFSEEWNAFKDTFHIGKIEQLSAAKFNDAMAYLGGRVKTLWIDSDTAEVNESELKALGNRLSLLDERYKKVHQIKARMYGLQCEMDGLIADMNTFVSQTSDPVNEAVAIAKHLIH